MCREEIQEFSATAADVQHRPSAFEERHVGFEPFADDFTRASELVFEADVLVGVEGRRECISRTALAIGIRAPGSGIRRAPCGSTRAGRRHALQFALHRHQTLLQACRRCAQIVVLRAGQRIRQCLHARADSLFAQRHRFPSFGDAVGEPVERRVEDERRHRRCRDLSCRRTPVICWKY